MLTLEMIQDAKEKHWTGVARVTTFVRIRF